MHHDRMVLREEHYRMAYMATQKPQPTIYSSTYETILWAEMREIYKYSTGNGHGMN